MPYGIGRFPRYPDQHEPNYVTIGSACLRDGARAGALPCPSDFRVSGLSDMLTSMKKTTTLPGFSVGAVAGVMGGLAVGLLFTGIRG